VGFKPSHLGKYGVDEIAGLRKVLVSFGKYGFIIHYVIIEDDVVILRVYNGRENRPR